MPQLEHQRALLVPASVAMPPFERDTANHAHANRPMPSRLVLKYPAVVEDCDPNVHPEVSESMVGALGLSGIPQNTVGQSMSNLLAQPSQKYLRQLTKKASLTPPVGRPLSGPPQLFSVHHYKDPTIQRKKRGASPTTVHYASRHDHVEATDRGNHREMSADEKLFVEAASALAHAEESDQRPPTKKAKHFGMPPPPFSLQQRHR